MFEAGRDLGTRELLLSFGKLSLEEKKVDMTDLEAKRKVKGDIG